VVARPRVDAQLTSITTSHEVVLVIAAAGAGKTTAVAQYVDQADCPVAWLTLDDADRLPGRFVTYLAAAVAAVDATTSREVLALLEDGLAPSECAALLGERLPAASILVIDDVHHLTDAEHVLHALRTFLRYVGPGCTVILVGRTQLPLGLERDTLASRVGGMFDQTLAFTLEETTTLLAARGSASAATALHGATGGWAAGIVFDSLTTSTQANQLPPGGDPLFAYLGAEIFDRLPAHLQRVLLHSSILESVTQTRLTRLFGSGVDVGIFDELCRQHLPATVENGQLRYHPRFREFLEHRFCTDHPGELAEVRTRLGRMLAEDGYLEEAVDSLLAAGELDEAEVIAEHATKLVIKRGDWDKVILWSEQLGDERLRRRSALRGAQIRALLLARRTYEVEQLVHGMLSSGEIGRLTIEAPDVVAWAVWALHASGEWAKLLPLLPSRPAGRSAVVRHLFCVSAATEPPPELPREMLDSAQPLHVALQSALYYQGRFDEVDRLAAAAAGRGPVTAALGQIHRIAVLRERGDIDEARAVFDSVAPRIRASRYLEFWHHVDAELCFEEGRHEDALELIREARRRSREHGYRIGDRALFASTEGKLLVRMGRPSEALEILSSASDWCAQRGLLSFREWADAWLGAALLLLDEPSGRVADRLRSVVASMERATRRLELSAAAIFLAEAQWRIGDEDAHDRACDLALRTAEAQGTLAPIVRALALFPDVLSRRIDAGGERVETWRHLLSACAPPKAPRRGEPVLRIHTFGEGWIEVDNRRVPLRLAKAIELAAYLARAGDAGVSRARIVHEIFGESGDGNNYLRQCIHRLRRVLPANLALATVDGRLSWTPVSLVRTDDQDFEALVSRARIELGGRRVRTLERALTIPGDGTYLADLDSDSIERRRDELRGLQEEARVELARGLLQSGSPFAARTVLRDVLQANAFNEDAWQLMMRAEAAVEGPEAVAGVLVACRQVFAASGLEPCQATLVTAARLRERLGQSSDAGAELTM
jgi:ATP/maltotriose-dependent transcriptional regulator MalT/DNA-binding SARP family transcriptional activator